MFSFTYLAEIVGIGVVILLIQYTVECLRSPLKSIPGPFLAKFTNWWRLYDHYRGTHIETQTALHRKYGDIVRLGPNIISSSDPNLVKVIYNTRGTFAKSDFYSVNDALHNGNLIQNLFSTRSNAYHSSRLRPIQKLYSSNNALEFESFINGCLRLLCSQLESRFIQGINSNKTCDLTDWIAFFSWDVMAEMTFSHRIGFIEQGKDVDDMIMKAKDVTQYFSIVGQIPVLDKFLGKNTYLPIKFSDYAESAEFCSQQLIKRVQNLDQNKNSNDFMNGFIKAKEDFPGSVTDNEIIGYLILNMAGGADTAGVAMQVTFYHILKNPIVKSKLVAELRSAKLEFPPDYKDLVPLPYLGACIKEGLRLHPVGGHLLERVVPATGLHVPSKNITLPPGTIVGMNPWVLSRLETIYGEKTDEFIPERWLKNGTEEPEEYERRVKLMTAIDLGFGSGNRVCLGRPLAMVELYKIIATLFSRYEISLEDPAAEMTIHKQWFVWPSNLKVKVTNASF